MILAQGWQKVKLAANFMIFSLFLRISEICCLLMPDSAEKLVVFSPFSNCKIMENQSQKLKE